MTEASDTNCESTDFAVPDGYDLMRTMLITRVGGGSDPSICFDGPSVWRAMRTPQGSATTRYTQQGRRVFVRAWGEGKCWAIENARACCGLEDEPDMFEPAHDLLHALHRKVGFTWIPKTRTVVDSMVASIFGQRVTGGEAAHAWRRLLQDHGDAAPQVDGAPPLRVPVEPKRLANIEYFAFHPYGVERKRAETIRAIAHYATRLDALVTRPVNEVYAAMQAIHGVGPWTAAETALVALGDADALSVGDFHVKNLVAQNLAGRARGTDDEMVEILEQFRPHRARVIQLLRRAGSNAPKFGPRYAPLPIARW